VSSISSGSQHRALRVRKGDACDVCQCGCDVGWRGRPFVLARLDSAAVKEDRHALIVGVGAAVSRPRCADHPSRLGRDQEIAASTWHVAERRRSKIGVFEVVAPTSSSAR